MLRVARGLHRLDVMENVVGVVDSEERAREVGAAIVGQIPSARIRILTPRTKASEVAQVPTDDAEQPGMGSAIGAVAGGAAGAAVASMLVPPVGVVAVLGLAAGALLGGLGGMATGHKMEEEGSFGLSRDELLVYADVLRCGRSLVLAWVEDDDQAERVRETMAEAGVDGIDAARDQWWIGLRDRERAAYGEGFDHEEPLYRRGFEAGCRGQACAEPESGRAFEAGYARGRAYVEDQMRQLAVTRPSIVDEGRPPL
jgi:hypothetical protein